MKFRILIASVLALLYFGGSPAFADACSNRAREVVAGIPGAMLLAVDSNKQSNGQIQCVARIKLPSKDGNPGRVVTREFRP
ncbi:MAG: hypothetical protein ACR2O3_10420 [Rhizobiaceae bacterium]